MATGGIFQLITNDGKQDRMLMATELLNQRLKNIRAQRMADPRVTDPTPTLSDIEKTHVLFMNAHFKPFAAIGYEYNRVRPQSGVAQLGSEVTFSIPQFGDFFNDMVLHIRLSGARLQQTGQNPENSTNCQARFRYAEWLGERLVERVQMEVNGNPLDEYDSAVYNFHRQLNVQPNKLVGWSRCVGQEIPLQGYRDQSACDRQNWREVCAIAVGPQTPTETKGDVDLFVPLLFWFNKDPRLSIPSVSIPYGQRFINVRLAPAEAIIERVAPLDAEGNDLDAGNTLTPPTISVADLYINNIFVNPEIHDIFIRRIGFSLIRVHRRQTTLLNKAADEILLQQLKWPIEAMAVGFRPTENLTVNERMENWHRYHRVVKTTYQGYEDKYAAYYTSDQLVDGQVPVDPETGCPTVAPCGVGLTGCTAMDCLPVVDRITIQAHGVPLYNDIPAPFFNAYTPYIYGGYNVNTPTDCGVYLITFNLYPGSYQPSGHINISRAREFFLKYSSLPGAISSEQTCDLVVVASAINFLLISDGSAVLRYST